MPIYNGHAYVPAAIESLRDQTYRDFELLLLDDGSSDGTEALVRDAAQRDARIRLVQRENRGLVATLNEGLGMARGEYIVRMDGDDVALPERIARQVAFMDGRPECVAAGSQVLFMDVDDRPIAPKPELLLEHDAIDAALLAGAWPIVHPSIIARRSALLRIGGYRDFPTWEDHDLFLRLAEIGTLANMPDLLLHYRLHLKSVVHQRGSGRAPVLQQILREADARRGRSVRPAEQLPTYRAPTVEEHQRTWAWWALAAGNVRTARHYAWRVFRAAPLTNWRVLLCSWRGR
jgi:glycosyltransferase involved in cell wall biosynthesis